MSTGGRQEIFIGRPLLKDDVGAGRPRSSVFRCGGRDRNYVLIIRHLKKARSKIARRVFRAPKVVWSSKHALKALGDSKLVLADVNPPIGVFAPDRFGMDMGYSRAVSAAGSVIRAPRIFGRNFYDVREPMADPNRLIFDDESSEPLPEQ
ncbi:MAG: hypothetical protein ABSG65_23575 [Bryobacteraceae bacterium]